MASVDYTDSTTILKNIADKETATIMLGFSTIQVMCDPAVFAKNEPLLLHALPTILQSLKSKDKDLANLTQTIVKHITTRSSPHVIGTLVLPVLLPYLASAHTLATRMFVLDIVESYTITGQYVWMVAKNLHIIIPALCSVVNDARKELAKRGEDVLYACVQTCINKDIQPFLKVLVDCLAHPEKISECIHALSATTFVQAVETPTIAIILPILKRGLAERTIATVRRTTVICENMCKLVENPRHAVPLIETIMPLLEKTKTSSSDPECRTVASRAYETLLKASKTLASLPVIDVDGALSKNMDQPAIRSYVLAVIGSLIETGSSDKAEWLSATVPHMASTYNTTVANDFIDAAYTTLLGSVAAVETVEESGEDLCNCEFSLAYGGKILLSQTRLHLRRGQRYGLCGANGTGKSTLLRAIANGQLEGFPSKDEVRTAVVEHDLDGSLSDQSCFDYILAGTQCDKDEVIRIMEDVGFGAKRRAMSIFALSGGWKMKLALARAMLMKADILLLDEPTNHLDVTNVAWLADHLNAQTNVTSLIVSHDTGFLDKVCSAIVHYEGFKLKKYLGNLTEFVKIHPEAKSYYSITDSVSEFSFPAPGLLEGINSKGAPFMKMNGVTYTYPGCEAPSISDASVLCSLSSRVGCVGPNGAGKSTLIKVLMGEVVPQKGTVWKHPNLRAAYVAQHAFHHLEEHLDKTPSEYIQWRFRSGDDHEAMNKEALALTEAEEKAIAAKITVDGGKFVVEKIMGRIKEKGVMMYEVKFVDFGLDKNKWVPRAWFTERGISKMVDVFDAQKAAEEGLLARPLTAKNIVKHLQDVGLDEEFTLHSRIRGLSGGQKVKVVIGAAMWMNPHMVVLDEPTNYLDRDSLGALAKAIQKYEGGVVVISHNAEFTKTVCTEHWYVNDGQLRLEGNNVKNTVKIDKPLVADTVTDAAGNVIKVKQKREYTQKEIKEKLKWHKEKQKRAKAGEDVSDDDEVLIEMDLI